MHKNQESECIVAAEAGCIYVLISPGGREMAAAAGTNDLVKTLNYLLDDVLGLDGSGKLATASTSVSIDKEQYVLDIKVRASPSVSNFIDLVSFGVTKDHPEKILDKDFKLTDKIQHAIDGYAKDYVEAAIEGIDGAERGIVVGATVALQKLLSAEITAKIATEVSKSLVSFGAIDLDPIADGVRTAIEGLSDQYFALFVPEVVKAYAKIGISEILSIATTGIAPKWVTAINAVGEGVLKPIVGNIVDLYFADPDKNSAKVFDDVDFAKTFHLAVTSLLIDFDKLDKTVVDDILGLDGSSWVETKIAKLVGDTLNDLIKDKFIAAIDFLGGDFELAKIEENFGDFLNNFQVADILKSLFVNYAGGELAKLFVDIDSLPEELVSQLGATIAGDALGQAIGAGLETLTGLFSQAAATAIGTGVFQGIGAILGAGVGAVAGSLVFELVDSVFDGAISGFFEDIADWIFDDSPQAYYRIRYDPTENEFVFRKEDSEDSDRDLRRAVKTMSDAFEEKLDAILKFIDQPASFDTGYDDITTIWGKKNFESKFATYRAGNDKAVIVKNKDATLVVQDTIGAVLHHMNFHSGNATIAKAYDAWKADVAATAVSDIAYAETKAFAALENLIGLARFANDYRQNPELYDQYMASDAPIGITILQQYLEAQARGFNDATTLKGSELEIEEVGSAAAGDTIILDGHASRAIARGGNDTIVAGSAARQVVDGGTGDDTLVLAKNRDAFTVKNIDRSSRSAVLVDTASGMEITFTGVETFKFNGTTLLFDKAFPNHAPVIGSNGGGDRAAIGIAENTLLVTTVTAIDADGDLRRFALSGDDAALFVIDVASGAVSFRVAPDFEAPADADHDNVYSIVASASDGVTSDTQVIDIRVTNIVDRPNEGVLLLGSAGNDVIGVSVGVVGAVTARDDIIYGYDGDDNIHGADGNDHLLGGGGNDVLTGANGDDLLDGGVGDDVLFGTTGNDILNGNQGNDRLYGGNGIDILVGGAGNDRFFGTRGELSGDSIGDLTVGDRITVTDAVLASFAYLRAGSALSIGDGATIRIGTPNARLAIGQGIDGGIDLTAVQRMSGLNDFDGNGYSDIFLRHRDGGFYIWQFGRNYLQFNVPQFSVAKEWQIAETFDFDGDGRSDLLWRNVDTGTWTIWAGSASGFIDNVYVDASVNRSWTIAATGDMNGDGKDDIVWRNVGGTITIWHSNGVGFTKNAVIDASVAPDWDLVGLADFNGDGKDDMLWRHSASGTFTEWQSTGSGLAKNAYVDGSVDPSWQIEGLGDFNGDGRDDIVWRHDSGSFTIWQATATGFATNTYVNGSVNNGWDIEQIGDFNNDGKADLLWRNSSSGVVTTWLSNGNGFDENSFVVSGLDTSWQIQFHDFGS